MLCAFWMHNFAQVLRGPSFCRAELIVTKLAQIPHLGRKYLCRNWFETDSGSFKVPKTQVRTVECFAHSWCTTLRKCCAGLPFIVLNSFWRNRLQYRTSDEYIFVLIDLEIYRDGLGFRKHEYGRPKVLCILDAQLCACVAPAFLLYCWTHCEEMVSNIAHRMNIYLF